MNADSNNNQVDPIQARGSAYMTHDVGLHARPSVTLTKLAKQFDSKVEISVCADGPWIDAKSIARVMKMRAPKDSTLHFQAEGSDAEAAVAAMVSLVEADFE